MQLEIEKLIQIYKSENNKLSCKEAIEISKILSCEEELVAEVADIKGVQISDCQLGEFGDLTIDNSNSHVDLYERIKPYIDIHRRISCGDALNLANKFGSIDLRSCLKEFNIHVKNCTLGFFKEKNNKKLFLKIKTWVEDDVGEVVFSKENNDSLDMIVKTGSIKKASEILDINYKKCWSHLKIFEKNVGESVSLTKRGSGADAGTVINEKALNLIDKYKKLQKEIDDFSNKRFVEIFFDESD